MEWEHHALEVMVEIARDTGNDLPSTKRVAAGDPRALRGIPVSGVPGGYGSTIDGTNPLAALILKETRAERRE